MEALLIAAAKWWGTWLFGIAATALLCWIRGIKKKQRALEIGVQALLRGELVRSYDKYHERDSITLHGLEAVETQYSAYHGLGGNGPITKLVENMKQLEVKD